MAALKKTIYSIGKIGKESRQERGHRIVSGLDDDTVPFHERIELLGVLQEAPPAATLQKLLKEAREQSLELSSFQIAAFLRLADNDPEVIETVKTFLNTPERMIEVAQFLNIVECLP